MVNGEREDAKDEDRSVKNLDMGNKASTSLKKTMETEKNTLWK